MAGVQHWSGYSLLPNLFAYNRNMMKTFVVYLFSVLVGVSCDVSAQKPKASQSWLSRYNLQDKQPKQFRLPKRISEASGLAMTSDGRLFTHDDERGVVYQLDYRRGQIVKQFSIGNFGVQEDFEGIAVKKDTIYMVASNGTIFEFREGEAGDRMLFTQYKTPLSMKNDVEGLEYDPETNALLLACKGGPGREYQGKKAIYAFPLSTKRLEEQPRFLIPLDAVAKKSHKGGFHPSGIARHPTSGTFFIISADGESVVELGKDGKILAQAEIPKRVNSQPEGIAFTPDGLTLILCNDGQGENGTLTLYPLEEK